MAERSELHHEGSGFETQTCELFGATAARLLFGYGIPAIQSAMTSPSCIADTAGAFILTQESGRVLVSASHEFLTTGEIIDVDESWKEIDEDKAKRFRNVDDLLKELKS
jgi:hypothetical protein